MIYIDNDFKCHATNPGGEYRGFNVPFFDEKCAEFIDGYIYVPKNESWTSPEGVVFYGEMIAPLKPYSELDAAQRTYERQLIVELQKNSVPIAELEAAYQEGVNSV